MYSHLALRVLGVDSLSTTALTRITQLLGVNEYIFLLSLVISNLLRFILFFYYYFFLQEFILLVQEDQTLAEIHTSMCNPLEQSGIEVFRLLRRKKKKPAVL